MNLFGSCDVNIFFNLDFMFCSLSLNLSSSFRSMILLFEKDLFSNFSHKRNNLVSVRTEKIGFFLIFDILEKIERPFDVLFLKESNISSQFASKIRHSSYDIIFESKLKFYLNLFRRKKF